jgi:putative phage-type endonuclease
MESMDKINYVYSIRQNIQKSIEWLEQRKNKLTSSDAATALGINPYENPMKLLFKKNGCGDKFIGNIATRHGEKYETEAINIYCNLLGKKNYEFGLIEWNSINPIRKKNEEFEEFMIKHGIDVNFLAGSPDGIAIDNANMEGPILLEVKCPFQRDLKYGQCPEHYYPQVQLNMAILDIEKADFIEYIPAGVSPKYLNKAEFNITRIHRDYTWFYNNIGTLHNFWKEVVHWRNVGIVNHPKYKRYNK